jgi:hypothetical protein
MPGHYGKGKAKKPMTTKKKMMGKTMPKKRK